jgi:hypothetical protein
MEEQNKGRNQDIVNERFTLMIGQLSTHIAEQSYLIERLAHEVSILQEKTEQHMVVGDVCPHTSK